MNLPKSRFGTSELPQNFLSQAAVSQDWIVLVNDNKEKKLLRLADAVHMAFETHGVPQIGLETHVLEQKLSQDQHDL